MTARKKQAAPPNAAPRKAPSRAKKAQNVPRPTAALTPLQERFIYEYLKDFNGTRAYMAANPGVKESTAGTESWKLLKNPEIQKAVVAARDRIADRLELTVERTMLEIARLAYFDARKLFDKEGNPLPITELDDHTAAAIAGLEVLDQFDGTGEERTRIGCLKKYRIADKNSALEKAAKIVGLFEADNRQRADALATMLERINAAGSTLPVHSDPDDADRG